MSKPKKSLMEVIEGTAEPVTSSTDTLDELLREEEQELVREAKRLKLQEIIESRRRKLQALTGANQTEQGGRMQDMGIAPAIFSTLVAQGLKPEQVQEYLKALTPETLAALNALSSNNPYAAMIVYAMTRSNPQQLTVKDVIEIADKMRGAQHTQLDIASLITAIGNLVKGGHSETSIMDLFTKVVQPMLTEAYKQRIEWLERENQELKQRPSFVQELAQKKDELEALKILLGGGGISTADLEKTKIMLEHERWKTEQELAMRKWQIEQGLAKERLKTVVRELVKPVLDRTRPLLDELAKAGQQRVRSQMPSYPASPNLPKIPKDKIALKCDNCGNIILVKPPLPDRIVCENCGAEYVRRSEAKAPVKEQVEIKEPEVGEQKPPNSSGGVKDLTIPEGGKVNA